MTVSRTHLTTENTKGNNYAYYKSIPPLISWPPEKMWWSGVSRSRLVIERSLTECGRKWVGEAKVYLFKQMDLKGSDKSADPPSTQNYLNCSFYGSEMFSQSIRFNWPRWPLFFSLPAHHSWHAQCACHAHLCTAVNFSFNKFAISV